MLSRESIINIVYDVLYYKYVKTLKVKLLTCERIYPVTTIKTFTMLHDIKILYIMQHHTVTHQYIYNWHTRFTLYNSTHIINIVIYKSI